jgi:hypothetical protein
MTQEQRELIRYARDRVARQLVEMWAAAHGFDECERCGRFIEAKPGRKFCGDACRRATWNATSKGRRQRLDAKRRYRARAAA